MILHESWQVKGPRKRNWINHKLKSNTKAVLGPTGTTGSTVKIHLKQHKAKRHLELNFAFFFSLPTLNLFFCSWKNIIPLLFTNLEKSLTANCKLRWIPVYKKNPLFLGCQPHRHCAKVQFCPVGQASDSLVAYTAQHTIFTKVKFLGLKYQQGPQNRDVISQ